MKTPEDISVSDKIPTSAWKILIILSCVGMIVMFDETMIIPAIPDFVEEFNISYSTSSWMLSAYIIAAAVMTPIAGRLSDIHGQKKILLIIIPIYIIGVFIGRFAVNIEVMLFARALQGVGMAMFPVAFGIIRSTIPEKKIAIAQTIFGSTFPAGAIFGLVGGAAIIQSYGWQATFVAILPVTIALWIIICRFIPSSNPYTAEENSRSVNKSLDLKGVSLLTVTIVTFLSAITSLESKEAGYYVAVLFAVSAISLFTFITVEKRVNNPLLDLKLMANRNFLPPTLILLLVSLSIFSVYLTVTVLVRSPAPLGFGGDVLKVANIQLPFMLVFLVTTVISGYLLNKIKNYRVILFGTSIATIGFFLLVMFHTTEESVMVGLTILAVGLSLSIAGGFNVILVSVPMKVTGIALGMAMLLNLVGMSVGPVFAGVFQDTFSGTIEGISGEFPTETAYITIFASAALISSASVVLSIIINKRKTEIQQ
ncbi:MAG: MFS transporter [Nitrosopumilus sp.]|nr:MFS transporter [Nitrosopumilus sp.]